MCFGVQGNDCKTKWDEHDGGASREEGLLQRSLGPRHRLKSPKTINGIMIFLSTKIDHTMTQVRRSLQCRLGLMPFSGFNSDVCSPLSGSMRSLRAPSFEAVCRLT